MKQGRDPFIEMLMTRGRHITFILRTTSACNLRCSYCYQHKQNSTFLTEKHLEKIKSKIVKRIQEQRKKYNNDFDMKFVFVGGEITLNKNNSLIFDAINEALNFLNITNYKSFEILTNCYYIDDTFLDFLSKCKGENNSNRVELYVSLDFNEELTNNIRKSINNDTYKKVIKNIKLLSELGYSITCNAVINNNTLKYNPKTLFKNFINTFENEKIKYEINVTYEYSIDGENNIKLLLFLKKLYEEQTNKMIECLNGNTNTTTRFILLHLSGISYFLCYKDRTFCDLENCYGIEAIDDSNIVTFNCHSYTYNKNKKMFGELERTNKETINYYDALVAKIKNYNCNTCDLSPFCRQKCVNYRTDDRECVEFNKMLAIITLYSFIKVFEIPDFYNKFLNYIKDNSRTGIKEYNSWKENKHFWVNRIEYYREVYKKYEQIYNKIWNI